LIYFGPRRQERDFTRVANTARQMKTDRSQCRDLTARRRRPNRLKLTDRPDNRLRTPRGTQSIVEEADG
jgi:hypothetical protein